MEYVLGGLVIAFILFMAYGAITGKIKAQSCCNIVPVERDLRMNPHSDL